MANLIVVPAASALLVVDNSTSGIAVLGTLGAVAASLEPEANLVSVLVGKTVVAAGALEAGAFSSTASTVVRTGCAASGAVAREAVASCGAAIVVGCGRLKASC